MKRIILKILGLAISAVALVFLLLLVVWIFDIIKVDVPGSREMWIGLIGTILGGFYTMLGVIITIEKQEYFERENQRISNMPLIKVKVKYYIWDDLEHYDYSYCNTCTFDTTDRQQVTAKKYPVLIVKSSDDKAIFNVRIVSCMIEGYNQVINFYPWGSEMNNRILKNESIRFSFKMDDKYFIMKKDCLYYQGLIRVYYEDMVNNAYYQDIPCYIVNNETIQMISLKPMNQPILISGKEKTIVDNFCSYNDELPFN